MTPEGAAAPTPKPRPDDILIKALLRAHRWRRWIESGQAKSITDLAEQEGVTDAYVYRSCRLPASRRVLWRRSWIGGSCKAGLANTLVPVASAGEAQQPPWGFVIGDVVFTTGLPSGYRDAHSFNPRTRWAITERANPFSVSSPTGSASTRSSTAANARWLTRMSPSRASSQSREARLATGPTAV
jgi:hypothetical protein